MSERHHGEIQQSLLKKLGGRAIAAPEPQQILAAKFIESDNASKVGCGKDYFLSQYGEDVVVTEFFSKLLGKGRAHEYQGQPLFFLEMGALDGLSLSNTFYLENCHGWRGLLIEAMPSNFQHVERNRPCTDKAWTAAGPKSNSMATFQLGGSNDASSHMLTGSANAKDIVHVPMSPLHEVFASRQISRIDFWSLDVEGSELEVLKTVDWARLSVGLIMFEILEPKGAKTAALRKLLADSGMTPASRPTVRKSEIWVNQRHLDQLSNQA